MCTEMGKKVDITAIATLILPQLWAMSMGPLLSAQQFDRFMTAIDRMGGRVRQEHSRHLAEVKRLEESSANPTAGAGPSLMIGSDGEVDFAALVRGVGQAGGAKAVPADPFGPSPIGTPGTSPGPSWDDTWGADPTPAPAAPTHVGLGVNGTSAGPMRLGGTGSSSKAAALLGAKPLPRGSFDTAAFPSTNPTDSVRSFGPRPTGQPSTGSFSGNLPSASAGATASWASPALTPSAAGAHSGTNGVLQPSRPNQPRPATQQTSSSGPNYNISLAPQPPSSSTHQAPVAQYSGLPPLQPQTSSLGSLQPQRAGSFAGQGTLQPNQARPPGAPAGGWNIVPPPGFNSGSVLQPTKNPNAGLSDFDPFA